MRIPLLDEKHQLSLFSRHTLLLCKASEARSGWDAYILLLCLLLLPHTFAFPI